MAKQREPNKRVWLKTKVVFNDKFETHCKMQMLVNSMPKEVRNEVGHNILGEIRHNFHACHKSQFFESHECEAHMTFSFCQLLQLTLLSVNPCQNKNETFFQSPFCQH